ncbi:hypothetical protein QYE76_065407 [Lolium multiflorum]|uniref:Uncharacterized protein n=1 Tax=Lolium multiflorum TaxID=4521 RepID=A0AAD8S8T5_LOLMU|nr:hypothetical protein QYE76_065407 [Lolium multiflorum]
MPLPANLFDGMTGKLPPGTKMECADMNGEAKSRLVEAEAKAMLMDGNAKSKVLEAEAKIMAEENRIMLTDLTTITGFMQRAWIEKRQKMSLARMIEDHCHRWLPLR